MPSLRRSIEHHLRQHQELDPGVAVVVSDMELEVRTSIKTWAVALACEGFEGVPALPCWPTGCAGVRPEYRYNPGA